jgi:beta-glucanase (GH16 family)
MLRKGIAYVTAAALVVTSIVFTPVKKQTVQAEVAGPGESGWNLVWSDEFNGNALDTSTWIRETGGTDGGGWGNNELQYYTNRTDNSYVSDGTLKMIAKRENYNGCRFTSARLKTAGRKSFKYGKMEARIRVLGGNQDGVWPAFWMMGDDGLPWPRCGELDIMEHANGRDYVEGTLHWGENGTDAHVFWGSYSNRDYYYFNDNANNGITAWHTYGVTWDESSVKWYVDGNVYLTGYFGANNAYAFQKAHYFLLNLALGSNNTPYTGGVAPNNSFQSATMEVDYVRAYSYNGSNSGGGSTPAGYTACGKGNWNDVGAWRYYVGDGAAAYKGGNSINDFSVYVQTKPTWDWGIQAKPEISLEANTTYNYTINATSSKATGALVVNRDLGGNGVGTIVNKGIIAGNNTFSGSFTTGGTAGEELVFDLANIDSDTTFSITNVSITKQSNNNPTTAEPTTAQPTTEQIVGTWEAVPNSTGLTYYTGTTATVVNVQNPGWTEGNYSGDGIYMNVPEAINSITLNGNNAGVHVEGAGALVYLSALKTGDNTVSITYGGNKTTTVQIKKAAAEVTTQEPTTEKPADGFTAVPASDLQVGDFTLYAANGSWTTGKMSYKGTGNNMDLTVRVDEASGEVGSWGLQMKYPVTGLDPTKTYDVAVKYESTKAGTILAKIEEGSGTDGNQQNVTTAVGTTNYTTSVSGESQYKVVLELSGMPNGTELKMKSITFTPREVPTTAEPTTAEPTTAEPTTAEPTTEEPTTVDPKTKVKIRGYQISTKHEGYRVVGSVEPTINGKNVESYGVVYAIKNLFGTTDTDVTDADMVVDSTHPYVKAFEANDSATLNAQYGDSTTAINFAQVMKFGRKNVKAFNTVYATRVYARLEDGTYVYSDVQQSSVFAIAKKVYDNGLMSTYAAHNYLYEEILKVVDPSYEAVDFDWKEKTVDPGMF